MKLCFSICGLSTSYSYPNIFRLMPLPQPFISSNAYYTHSPQINHSFKCLFIGNKFRFSTGPTSLIHSHLILQHHLVLHSLTYPYLLNTKLYASAYSYSPLISHGHLHHDCTNTRTFFDLVTYHSTTQLPPNLRVFHSSQ